MPDSLKFILEMQDKLSAPAKAAAQQLAVLQNSLRKEQLELRRAADSMKQYQAATKKSGVADVAAYRAIEGKITAGKANVANLQDQITVQRDAALSATELGEGAIELGGVYTAAAAAVLAFAAAIGVAVIAGAGLAIHAAEQKQDTLDMLEAMMGTSEAATSTYAAIEGITSKVAISQERATGLARELTAAGVTNKDALTGAITAIGQVESVLGSEAGNKIQNVLEKAAQSGQFKLQAKQLAGTGVQVQKLYEEIAKRTGKGVAAVKAEVEKGTLDAKVGIDALTAVISTKFGDVAAKQVLDIGSQFTRFKDNVSRLFEDVDTGPFLEALSQVLALFDQSTASGQVMKAAITEGFNAIFSAAAKALPYIVWGFKQLIIWGLEAYIAIKKFTETDTFGYIVTGAQYLIACLIMLAGIIAVVVAAWVAMQVAAVYLFGAVIGQFVDLYNTIMMYVDGFTEIGRMLVQGIVNGITSGAGAVVDAVKGMATSALNSFKSTLGIASPSKVMAEMGGHLTMGLAQGIDRGAPAANDSMAAVVEPAAVQSAASGGASAAPSVSASSGGVTVNITINGVAGAEQLKESLPGILADAFEQLALQKAAPVAA